MLTAPFVRLDGLIAAQLLGGGFGNESTNPADRAIGIWNAARRSKHETRDPALAQPPAESRGVAGQYLLCFFQVKYARCCGDCIIHFQL